MERSRSQTRRKKTVLILGASRGIGAATARYFERNNYRCLRAARGFSGSKRDHFMVDITKEASVRAFFKHLEKRSISLDLVIFSVGIGHFAPLEKLTLSQWNETIGTNLSGAFLALTESYKHFIRFGTNGRLLVIGSLADHLSLPENSAYSASKFGLRGLVSVMHEEGKRHGISTTLMSLGATFTDIWKTRPEFSPHDMLSADEVAETIFAITTLPQKVTIPHVVVTPPKGIL